MKNTVVYCPSRGVVKLIEEELVTDNLAPKEVVIENETSIISAGTELARIHEWEEGSPFPYRPGYGAIGKIVEKGGEVSDFTVGERVYYAGKHAAYNRFLHGQNHQWGNMVKLPDALDPRDAVVGTMAQIAMTAPTITELRHRDRVVVFGMGVVGVLAAQLYKLRGAQVLGVDPSAERCKIAEACGIEAVAFAPANQITSLRERFDGKGPEVCVDASGLTPVVATCIEAVGDFGQVLLLGSPRKPYEANLTKSFSSIHTRGLVVRGAHMWRFPMFDDRNQKTSVSWMFQTVFNSIADGSLVVRPLVSHVIKPEHAVATYEALYESPSDFAGAVIDWRG